MAAPAGGLRVGDDDAALGGPAIRHGSGESLVEDDIGVPDKLVPEDPETIRGTSERLDEVVRNRL